MTSTTTRPHPEGTTQDTTLRKVLHLPGAVLFGLSYMIPLTVFTTYGVVNVQTEGHLVAAYVITTLAMLFTAASYAAMVRAFPRAGSAYTYTRRTLGDRVGFLGGWALLLDYLLMPMITYLVIGIYLGASFPAVPQWVWILATLGVVTVLNIVGVELVSRVSTLMLVVQAVFIVVFAALSLRHPAPGGAPSVTDAFSSQGPGAAAIFAGAAVLCLSFLGFDAVSAMAEETVEARRTIPRAIIIVTLCGGALFVLLAVLSARVFPDWTAYTSAEAASLDVMQAAGGQFLTNFFTAAYIAGCLGAVLASQGTVSRILYAMGRDGVLPTAVFGHLHPRFRTPVRSILVVGAIGLLALVMDLFLASSLISFGALTAFTLVNAAVVKHYVIDLGRRTPRALARYLVAPGIGIGLCLWLWTSLSSSALQVGLGWTAVGVLVLVTMSRTKRGEAPVLAIDEA
ncbi:APC family permease [Intrasporangium sp.]|uniref:APC family permease n=1 Tax=Intrasporangium sp. TaxID=1925024 RepID=UPI0032216062